MASVEEARQILAALGLPRAQQNRMAGLTLIALCGLGPEDMWAAASRRGCTITKGLMDYLKVHYSTDYAPNTRETFRRQVLHQFVQAGVADYNPFDSSLPTNSPRAHYAVSEPALETVRAFGTPGWAAALRRFQGDSEVSRSGQHEERRRHGVSVRTPDGRGLVLSPGSHNLLQRAVIEDFAPRFASGAHLLYLGDTAKKDLVVDDVRLGGLGIAITGHDKLPDIVLHYEERDWLFLIEAVTSHGPVSNQRIAELEALLSECPSGRIYVTAFPDFAEFRKHMKAIAWDTEVWLAEEPGHLIHFNGDRFLEPRVR